MRLEARTLFGPRLGHRIRTAPPGFGRPHLLTLILLLVTLPVFLLGAVLALPIGAAVLTAELARSAWLASQRR